MQSWLGCSCRVVGRQLGKAKRALATMSASDIRQRYTDYFVKHGHTLLPSADIVPRKDATLLFSSAGMVPFKQFFVNPAAAPHKMVTTVQKCVRAGGKHNDLDQVGYTPRHHTFFEMLGNFSFGAYSKREIIRMAWKFVREELRMPEDRLRVTVLETDEEAYEIWRAEVGVDPQRIIRCGPEDNFWSMGNEGPCGPSSEIFWDTRDPRYQESDSERWLEFWNLVFMQYHRGADGELRPLSMPCVDTGMGLERVASILQGKQNNFETDEFQVIIRDIDARCSRTQGLTSVGTDKALACKRIVADHLRASAFLISEGVFPSNVGRGYVLRRIIRRAVRAGRLLGINESVLSALYPSLELAMGETYPELLERKQLIMSVLESEEKMFLRTLDRGLALLDGIFAGGCGKSVVSGAEAFLLYDTHGFPLDLTEIIAHDNGWSVDVEAFESIQRQSRDRNKASWKGKLAKQDSVAGEVEAACMEWEESGISSRFSGHDIDPEARPETSASATTCRVMSFRDLSNGDGLLVIDPCPFYATGGGQEADTGTVSIGGSSHEFVVSDAVALPSGQATVLRLRAVAGQRHLFQGGHLVYATVDRARRLGSAVHHTATHLLNAALRKTVGAAVMQAGSLVQASGLRFDFTSSPLTSEQLCATEALVNRAALDNIAITTTRMSLDEARERGAVAAFAEKYDAANVRVVDVVGVSMELCGGTHLRSTRAVYPFHITSEGSIGAGTRRIEAVAGAAGAAWLQQQLEYGRATAQTLGVAGRLGAMDAKAQMLVSRNKALRDEADRWLRAAAVSTEAVATHATVLGASGAPTIVHVLKEPFSGECSRSSSSARLVAERACHLRDTEPNSVHVVIQGRAVAVAVNAERFPGKAAAEMLACVLERIPGKGGGQAALAQGMLKAAVAELAQVAHLYISMPRICDPGVRQYSGYIEVAADKHLFYWFFESRSAWPARVTTPLVLWLNGGPGCSSWSGLLGGIGPCRISDNKHNTVPNPYSWNSNAHTLFLDQPTNVGFSYGASVNTTIEASVDVAVFLHKFYRQFPQYSLGDLHIMGESYAAHYVPAIAAQIVKDNQRMNAGRRLPLTTIALGNGLFNMETQYMTLPQMACNSSYPKIVNSTVCQKMGLAATQFKKSLELSKLSPTSREAAVNATFAGYDILTPYQDAGGNPYDVRSKCAEDSELCDPYLDTIADYADQPHVRASLGVRLWTGFDLCSKDVQEAFIDSGDELVDSSTWIPDILAAGVKVLNYAGDADLICNWIGNKALMLDMKWSGSRGFAMAKDQAWSVDGVQAGEARSYGGLTFLRVFGAGHMVGLSKPKEALDMLSRWASGRGIFA
ncbi:hypothetical protein GGI20_005551 [Coemansia sp. BCRC 34301]|nr:hypothetical protein GGI20_005551 [Coemansia sp. BCRC 34301]